MTPVILQAENLKRFPELIHGFTTRHLGSDEAQVTRALSGALAGLYTLQQIHSAVVHPYAAGSLPSRSLQGDALVCAEAGAGIGVRTADCVPLIAYDPKHRAVAAIHAGWRGLIAGVIENALDDLQKRYSSKAGDLTVAIGAALCETCFEVGPEVAEAFFNKFGPEFQILKGQNDRSYLDLREGCREVLLRAGVPAARIETLPYCTACNQDLFYSYRKGDKEGRMLAFIGLRT